MKAIVFASLILLSVGTFCGSVVSADTGGPATLNVANTTLVKNGFGQRSKMFLALYEGSLYLQNKSNDATAIIGADEPMAFRIKITSKFVSQEKLVTGLQEGFQAATGGNTSAIAAEIQQFRACFAAPVKLNDVFVLRYAPQTGVTVEKNGAIQGTVPGVAFKQALFGIWLGNNPVDAGLKTKLVGR
jgi:hypothetical protein